ncbi:MAG: hypothetical protein WCC04_00665 [Terriglobales bacterium]
MSGQDGYVLITLMLIFALMAIALTAALPSIKQQMQRDREDELRHRGTMYMRAIQHYYKRTGQYPSRIEDLESSNHVRYLRKRYKDPMSWDPQTHKERDFKILHLQDVTLNNGPMLGQGAGGLLGQGGLGALAGGLQGANGLQALGGLQAAGGLQNALGQMQQMGGAQALGGMQPQLSSQNQNSNTDSDSSGTGNSQGNSNSGSSGSSTSTPPATGPNGAISASSAGLTSQQFGGGAILGVASTDKKDKTIREFNKKNHYTDWYFIYDSSMDRGGLLVGPWQPLTITSNNLNPGSPGSGQPNAGTGPGQGLSQPGQSGFGQSGFGQSGFGQSPTPQNQQAPQNPGGNTPNNDNQ